MLHNAKCCAKYLFRLIGNGFVCATGFAQFGRGILTVNWSGVK